ncbi:MAG: ABC transporter substrate-binding protein [Alphaproteobacteria bacterium]|nr:ABC transporter substrate-binding protein [Alphaproteobacteria bacterium]
MKHFDLFTRQATFRALICMIALATMIPHSAQAESATKDFETFADTVFRALASDKEAPEDREAALHRVIVQGIDLEAIASFVLGDHRDEASEAQRDRFNSLYGEYLLGMLSRLLMDGEAKSLTVIEAKQVSDRTSIRSEVELASGKRQEWLWLMQKNGATHRVIDVKTDGVSLALMLKMEADSVIRRQGIDGFLVLLRKKL